MNKALTINHKSTTGWKQNRRVAHTLRLCRAVWWWPLVLLLSFSSLSTNLALAQDFLPTGHSSQHTLTLADILVEGSTRTSDELVLQHLGLWPGQVIDQGELIDSVGKLRDGGLFKSVDFHTRPGQQRGQLVLVLEVEEHGFDFRWTAGNTDLDGWYLAPIVLAKENPLGKGGAFDWQWRIGFRTSGTMLRYGRPVGSDRRSYWGAGFSAFNTQRPYFSDGIEYRHNVLTTGLTGVYGHRLSENSLLESVLKVESVKVQDHSEAVYGSEDGLIDEGQVIPEEDLPPSIARDVGRASRIILELDWQHDTRSHERKVGTPTSGLWGRLKGRAILQNSRSHPGLQADVRWYHEAPGGVLAARMRGALVGNNAPFHDRLYLGGMYTVRGFPTHSLSSPGGDTWLWSGSLEHRSQILGDHKGTKLAGIFFLDAGASGVSDGSDPYSGVAAAAGYGLRMRVWWLDWIGIDVGFPLTDRPVDMRFQVNASIGWSF